MEFENKHERKNDLQTEMMFPMDRKIYNAVENNNIKEEHVIHTNGEVANLNENTKFGGRQNVGNTVDVKMEVSHGHEYGNTPSVHEPTQFDGDSFVNDKFISSDQICDTTVLIVKHETEDECTETTDNTACMIEIDTCKDEYYENPSHVNLSNTVNVNLQVRPVAVDIQAKPYRSDVYTGSEAALNTHMSIHTEAKLIKPYSCSQCEVGFVRKGDLTFHMRIHTGEKTHLCSVCGVGFMKKQSLTEHARMHTGEKPHICSVCGVGYSHKCSLRYHMAKHSGEKRCKCGVCGVTLAHKSGLKRHMLVHADEKTHVCPVCEVGFTLKCNLESHMRSHRGEKTHICSVCGVGFFRKYHLKEHGRTHSGEKPYRCSVCGVSYKRNSGLKLHAAKNTCKRYKCSDCGVGFTQSGDLKTHQLTHTREKAHNCSVCGVGFTQKGTMRTHMRMHTEERPFSCVVCDASFTKKSGLVSHHTRKHTGQNSYT